MDLYEDPSAGTQHARDDRRHRVVSRIRGWLRKERSPRLTILALLVPCAVCVFAVDWGMRRTGFDLLPLRWAIAVLMAWPIFVGLLRWRASVEWRHVDLNHLGDDYIRHDEFEEMTVSAPKSAERLRLEESMRRGMDSGLQSGMQQGGAASLPLFLLLTALTLGGWSIWQLIRDGPTLISNTIVNGELVRWRPKVAVKISCENWFSGALGETGIYFLALMFAAFLFGFVWPFFNRIAP